MKRTTTATGLLTFVVMIVVGAFSAGSASAVPQFLWTGPLPALVLVLNDNTQLFEFEPGGTGIECEHFKGHAIASNGKAMTTKEITVTGLYTKCFFGEIFPMTVTPAEFLLNADGSVSVVGKPIVLTIPELGCSIKINSGPPNNNLRLILYLNLAQDVLAHVEIEKIASLGSGGLCGDASVEKTELHYTGLWLISVHGGTIRWEK
ncbi:MAG TPA: hypothetical protein VFY36_12425 [Solirubrobacteraceae bacterium]|nr:hypothetical protein [Solirubrobacteraceae bacterium]